MKEKRDRIYLESDKLKLILSEHREDIGKTSKSGIEKIITAIAFWIPMALADFSKWKTVGTIIQILLIIFGIVLMAYGIYETIMSIKLPFNKDRLFDEIQEANLMKEHPHSIVLIKDTFNPNANRFLVYYDSRWDCRLFLNYDTITSDFQQDEDNITHHLQLELKVPEEKMECAFEFEQVHEKYSVSAKENRCYRHRFYKFVITEFSEFIMQDSFVIDGKQFFWMSIADMEKDKRIMEANSDIVNMVKKVA